MPKITIELSSADMAALKILTEKNNQFRSEMADEYEVEGKTELAELYREPDTVKDRVKKIIWSALRDEGLIE